MSQAENRGCGRGANCVWCDVRKSLSMSESIRQAKDSVNPVRIHRIDPEDLNHRALFLFLYPNLENVYFWSDCWDSAFFVDLARAGFISISHVDPGMGPILLPELQEAYAVLDWKRLHLSRNVQRLMRSGVLEEEELELRVESDCSRVVDRIIAHHRPQHWLTGPYRRLLPQLPADGASRFSLQAVELWSRRRGLLIAGELGYSIGGTYTSLSGFCSPQNRRWKHCGTLQLVLLAEHLRRSGYSFWNLGHPSLPYKRAMGARALSRGYFLRRWFRARRLEPGAGMRSPVAVTALRDGLLNR